MRSVVLLLLLTLISQKSQSAVGLRQVGDKAGFSRELNMILNPDCDLPECKGEGSHFINLVHVSAKGDSDVIHYLWSTFGTPSVLIVQTSLKASLQINWESLLNESVAEGIIQFSEKPYYSFGLILAQLWQFNDTKDTGKLDISTNESFPISFMEMSWQNINETMTCSSDQCSVSFETSSVDTDYFLPNGSFSFQMTAHSKDGRNNILPHLEHTASSSQLNIVLNEMKSHFTGSRFALEFLFFSSDVSHENIDPIAIESRKSVDDEYTPGVFKRYVLTTPSSRSNGSGGYLHWKPVCYTNYKRTIAHSSDSSTYGIQYTNTSQPFSIVKAFFGPSDNNSMSAFNVSFGSAGDGFYLKTNYTSWSVAIGYGRAPPERLSLMVILIISIGVGAPLLLMAIGGLYFIIQKLARKKYDLLLSSSLT
ncbi:glycosylated lysosomal membrane protein A-like isoform X1 [Limulus polyphemus]|uniref:Glycosylated lysosomal membrane protein A-like isoform X1 n=2 Tax=Limulus polyphemus TaxID=6850 RepID=A0ABM1TPE1_LIMPO|nr:glycosylated lysosomal membrane protein A-like isoform X1 [Limulus polyphemus]